MNAARQQFDGLTLDDLRFVSALVGAGGCGVLYLAGRDLVGRACGLIGGALWAILPQNVAQGRLAGLGTATSLLTLLVVWMFFRGLQRQREGANSGYDLAAGSCAGLALAVQLGNAVLLVAIPIMYVAAHWSTIKDERRFPVTLTAGLLPLVVVVVFFAAEPRLWGNLTGGLAELLRQLGANARPELLFDGRHAPTLQLMAIFAVTTPAAVLALAAVGFGSAMTRRDAGKLVALLLLLLPFFAAPGSVGAIAPCLAGACLLAAIGADALGQLTGRVLQRESLRTPTMAIAGAAVGIYVLYGSVQVHPYYQLYFNEIVGGIETVAKERSFAIGRRGEGLVEASSYLERNAKKNAKVFVDAKPATLVRLRADLQRVESPDVADYVIRNRGGVVALKEEDEEDDDLGEVFSVSVRDVPLVQVFDRTAGKGATGE